MVVSQSPPGKPVAVVLALQHQCQDWKLTVALGENFSGSSENTSEIRIISAKSTCGERGVNEMENSCIQVLH